MSAARKILDVWPALLALAAGASLSVWLGLWWLLGCAIAAAAGWVWVALADV